MNPPGPRRLLFVCTANVCRSPTAEYLARHRFGEDHWTFRSAGFLDPNNATSDTLVTALDEFDIDVRGHRSYRLDPSSIAAADLILTMEGSHVRQAHEVDPSSYPKTLPLREAAAIIDDVDDSVITVEQLLAMAAAQRDPASYLGDTWDVDDPWGRNLRVYRKMVAEVDDLLDVVFGSLR